jgi:hypothetical protein
MFCLMMNVSLPSPPVSVSAAVPAFTVQREPVTVRATIEQHSTAPARRILHPEVIFIAFTKQATAESWSSADV